MNGLDVFGDPIIDPTNDDTTIYTFYGDPVAETGWYEGEEWSGDCKMLLSSGSFDLALGDSQEIEIAIIMALGDDNLDSVTKLKEKAAAVRQFYFTGDLTALEELDDIRPAVFVLKQNYPNPFNPTTIINYELQITNDVDLSVYNVLGQKVTTLMSGKQSAGSHQVEWDASLFASGVYYYVLKTGEFRDVKKMVLIK
jgi:hypothetical protein